MIMSDGERLKSGSDGERLKSGSDGERLKSGSDQRCCPYCFDYLVQGENESDWAFAQRTYCNKSHAALHQRKRGKTPVMPMNLSKNMGPYSTKYVEG